MRSFAFAVLLSCAGRADRAKLVCFTVSLLGLGARAVFADVLPRAGRRNRRRNDRQRRSVMRTEIALTLKDHICFDEQI